MSAPLSSRLRAGIECAPWVIDEVKRLEARLAEQPRVPEGYALISIDALKVWGVYDQVRDACQYPVAQQPQCHKRANDYCKCSRKAMLCDGVGPAQQPQAEAVPPDCDVRKIMVGSVPGPDGMGHEVYAKNVGDVVNLLTEMGQRVEDLEGATQAEALDYDIRQVTRRGQRLSVVVHVNRTTTLREGEHQVEINMDALQGALAAGPVQVQHLPADDTEGGLT